jgi:delta 1-pyrroline-5-carboxylate dehydrogenase
MMRELERLKEAEIVAAQEKAQRAAALMAEVAASNAAQIARKAAEREREAAEELRIAEYIRLKAAREEVRGENIITTTCHDSSARCKGLKGQVRTEPSTVVTSHGLKEPLIHHVVVQSCWCCLSGDSSTPLGQLPHPWRPLHCCPLCCNTLRWY